MVGNNESSLCLSVDCITAASDMLSSMDPQVDPCIDFYNYACGGWIRSNSIQDDESRADTYSIIRNQMSEKLKSKSQIKQIDKLIMAWCPSSFTWIADYVWR